MSEGEVKVCKICGEEKPINEFGILNSSPDGHNRNCRDCRNQKDRSSKNKTSKEKGQGQKRSRGRPKKIILPPKEVIDKNEESSEAQFIAAFKKATIKGFIKETLIPILEKIADEKFGESCQKI